MSGCEGLGKWRTGRASFIHHDSVARQAKKKIPNNRTIRRSTKKEETRGANPQVVASEGGLLLWATPLSVNRGVEGVDGGLKSTPNGDAKKEIR